MNKSIFLIFVLSTIFALNMKGQLVEKTYTLTGFSKLELSSFDDVMVREGDMESVIVKYHEAYAKYIQVGQDGKCFKMRIKKNTINEQGVQICITIHKLRDFVVEGCKKVIFTNLNLRDFKLNISKCNDVCLNNLSFNKIDLKLETSDKALLKNFRINQGVAKFSSIPDFKMDINAQKFEARLNSIDKCIVKGSVKDFRFKTKASENVNLNLKFETAVVDCNKSNEFDFMSNSSGSLDITFNSITNVNLNCDLKNLILTTKSCGNVYLLGHSKKFKFNNKSSGNVKMDGFVIGK